MRGYIVGLLAVVAFLHLLYLSGDSRGHPLSLRPPPVSCWRREQNENVVSMKKSFESRCCQSVTATGMPLFRNSTSNRHNLLLYLQFIAIKKNLAPSCLPRHPTLNHPDGSFLSILGRLACIQLCKLETDVVSRFDSGKLPKKRALPSTGVKLSFMARGGVGAP
jgi:hypothetical protein